MRIKGTDTRGNGDKVVVVYLGANELRAIKDACTKLKDSLPQKVAEIAPTRHRLANIIRECTRGLSDELGDSNE